MGGANLITPIIELAASSPRREMLRSRLNALGLMTSDVRDEPTPMEPILIDLASASAADIKTVGQQAMAGIRRPFILLGQDVPNHLKEAIKLRDERDLNVLGGELSAYYRRANIQEEASLRASSIQDLTGEPVSFQKRSNPSVLIIGGSSARFLALQAGLKANDIEVVAAFTAQTALDYLNRREFSAAIVDVDDDRDEAIAHDVFYSASASGLSHSLFVLHNPANPTTGKISRILPFATEILDCRNPMEDVVECLARQIFYQQAAGPITSAECTHPKIRDRTTGLFTYDFLHHHLTRQMQENRSVFLPLSFVTIEIESPADNNETSRRCLTDIANVIQQHLRNTDCAARLNWTSFGLSLRRTAHTEAARFAERCNAALAEIDLPTNINVTWRICEKRNTHSASSLINAALSAPQIRGMLAA